MTKEAKWLAAKLSKTQIDRLGDRLREGSPSEDDLRLLDDYRRSFGNAYGAVVRTIRERLQLEPTGRPAKSTGSIIEKLYRETIRLSQMQDIAGCRVVVAGIAGQDHIVVSLCKVFPGAGVVDRRTNPSYGYRAVHVIPEISGNLIEVQVRTTLQHSWAELSEKFSDVVDPTIKYGGGANQLRQMLAQYSKLVADFEEYEIMLLRFPKQHLNDQQQQQLEEWLKRMVQLKAKIVESVNKMIGSVENLKGQKR